MQTPYPLSSKLLLHPTLPFPPNPFFFLPSFPSPNFHSSLSLSIFSYPVQAPFTRSLLKPGKKAQRQQLATLFSRAGIEGLGALCMSEPHSSSSIQLCLCLRYSPRPYFVRSEGAQRKRRDHPFSLFVLHIAIQAFPKPPLMSWPSQCCERREREKQVCEREKRFD